MKFWGCRNRRISMFVFHFLLSKCTRSVGKKVPPSSENLAVLRHSVNVKFYIFLHQKNIWQVVDKMWILRTVVEVLPWARSPLHVLFFSKLFCQWVLHFHERKLFSQFFSKSNLFWGIVVPKLRSPHSLWKYWNLSYWMFMKYEIQKNF